MKFEVIGQMFIDKKYQKFVKEIEAASPSRAKELAYNQIGANHHIKRSGIQIEDVKELK